MAAGGAMAASAGIGALSSLYTGFSEAGAAKEKGAYEKSLADTNATMAEISGKQEIEAGDIAAGRKDTETRARVGSALAEQGASGVNVGSGSSALVRSGITTVGAVDELMIRNNAMRRAFGYKVQAIQDRSQGEFAKLTADNEAQQSMISGGIGAISTPLGIYSNYLRYSRYSGGGSGNIPSEGYV